MIDKEEINAPKNTSLNLTLWVLEMEYKKVKNKKIITSIRNEKNNVFNWLFLITIYLSKMAKKMIKNDKNASEIKLKNIPHNLCEKKLVYFGAILLIF